MLRVTLLTTLMFGILGPLIALVPFVFLFGPLVFVAIGPCYYIGFLPAILTGALFSAFRIAYVRLSDELNLNWSFAWAFGLVAGIVGVFTSESIFPSHSNDSLDPSLMALGAVSGGFCGILCNRVIQE